MYKVEYTNKASRQLKKLPKKHQSKISSAVCLLESNPFLGKKLQGEHAGLYALRVWPYRIIYTIEKKIVTVTVLAIGHRQGVYRKS